MSEVIDKYAIDVDVQGDTVTIPALESEHFRVVPWVEWPARGDELIIKYRLFERAEVDS